MFQIVQRINTDDGQKGFQYKGKKVISNVGMYINNDILKSNFHLLKSLSNMRTDVIELKITR